MNTTRILETLIRQYTLSLFWMFMIFFVLPFNTVNASVTVTVATGGSSVSADTAGGTYTSLTGPVISEGVAGDVGVGTIVFDVPSGFAFDTGGTAPSVLLTRISGSGADTRNINDLASGSTISVSVGASQLSITITAASSNGAKNSLTWQNVRVRPTSGTPLASGSITKSGTSVVNGITDGSTNFGTLTEVVGAKTQVVITTEPSSAVSTATDFGTKPVVAIRDQFGNTVTTDSSSTITPVVVLSTQVCGGTAGSGTLSTTPASGSAVTSGVLTYTAMQYSTAEAIKICFASSGVTSALSTTVTVSTPADTTAPSAVSTLALSGASDSAITVSWTAPGDDGATGTATLYDLRYSASLITSDNFSSATEVSGEPTPSVAGSSESKTVTGLSSNTTYYFALKTSDEAGNASVISNVPSLATTNTSDTTAPAAVSNLALGSATASSLQVTWTAPGDDSSTGTATTYDLRYSSSAITSGNFSSATAVTGEPTPSVAGSSESVTVSGLSPSTTYYFALKTSDEVPNTSAISNVPNGSTSESAATIEVPDRGGVMPSTVSFAGLAYPGAKIQVLRKSGIDGVYTNVPISSSKIEKDGKFRVQYIGLIGSDYFFALQASDKDGRKTGVLSFNADLLSKNLIVEDLLLPPTLGFKSALVKRGGLMELEGYAAPQSIIELVIAGTIKAETRGNDGGHWSYATSTQNLKIGPQSARARQIVKTGGIASQASDYSLLTQFKVTNLSNPLADFNNDDSVNIVDWSIFLFRWGSKDIGLKQKIDKNNDGKITIADFSLFLTALKF